MGRVGLVKFVKDVIQRLCVDAAAVVRDTDDGTFGAFLHADGDLAACRRELDGVREQIGPDKAQKLLVARDLEIFVHIDLQIDIFLFEFLIKIQNACRDGLAQVERFACRADLLMFQTVDVQNVGDHPGEARGGVMHAVQILPALCLTQIPALQQLYIILNNGGRRLKFMGHSGDEIIFHDLGARKFRNHDVEVLVENIEFILFPVLARFLFKTHRKVAGCHFLRRLAELKCRLHEDFFSVPVHKKADDSGHDGQIDKHDHNGIDDVPDSRQFHDPRAGKKDIQPQIAAAGQRRGPENNHVPAGGHETRCHARIFSGFLFVSA